MTDAATPIAVEQLGKVFGPSIGFYVVKCRNGGFLAVVNGVVHSAHSTLHETFAALGAVAATEYSESAVAPEQAKDVTPVPERDAEPIPSGIRPGPRVVRPPETVPLAERARTTALVVLGLLAVGTRGLMGV